MKNNKENVWVGLEQLNNDPALHAINKQEFIGLPIVDQLTEDSSVLEKGTASRRDFLKYLGFGIGAATIAASCDIPVKRAIPYVVKPDEIVPGVATYYASTFVNGGDFCPVLVKTREGRPIKIEGNSLSPMTKGGTSARAQASVLTMYNTQRYQSAMKNNNGQMEKISWSALDKAITDQLNSGSRIRLVSNTIMSPTAKKAIQDFQANYPNAKLVMYDAVSSSAIIEANNSTLGQATIPDYHFDRAEVIVSFGADFLGSWISPVEYARQYASNRKIEDTHHPKMSHHIQVESYMSLTGSNADNRVLIRPSEQGAAIATLYKEVAALNGGASINAPAINEKAAKALKEVAKRLNEHKGKCLIVSDSNNVSEQVLINAINDMLGSYQSGGTISFAHASNQRQGTDAAIQGLVDDMKNKRVDAVFFMNDCNPAFDLPNAAEFINALGNVALKVSTGIAPNETTILCDYVATGLHYLESWGDVEAKRGHYNLIQPTIPQLFDARQAELSLLVWAGIGATGQDMSQDTTAQGGSDMAMEAEQPYYEYLKAHWQTAIFPQQSQFLSFQNFWDSALHDGVFNLDKSEVAVTMNSNPAAAAAGINTPGNGEIEIIFFETVNVGAGQYSDNPWLMEMPDPLNRTVWGNYLAIPVGWDGGNSYTSYKNLNDSELYGEADRVDVTVNGETRTLTCVRQFGLAEGTLAVALGYGRELYGLGGTKAGENIYPWLSLNKAGNTTYYTTQAEVTDRVGKDKEFACVQYHHTMGVTGTDPETNEQINVDEKTVMTVGSGFQGGLTNRSIIYQKNIKDIEELLEHIEEHRAEAAKLNSATLYPFEEYSKKFYSQGHHWGMHVDLNACIGCGACQVACISENNVPVVGKKEVHRHHEMTWLRIDRYYYGDFENPNVVYQPMMCQHCDNAPCENVCPVAATNHSSEGLNQMTYNRCIGTRYCANNCPYKVRRFNWLDYTTADIFPANEPTVNGESTPYGADNLTRMVLNPDVTVRSRGVIEKCSFCVQRIQEGKLTAKRENRRLRDGDVKSACQTACPTGAITFGDMNDQESAVVKKINSPLNYRVLEETNTQTSVFYSAKINNRDEAIS